MGYEKNMSFHVIPKSPKVWKKVKRSDWAPLSAENMNQKTLVDLRLAAPVIGSKIKNNKIHNK